MMEDEIFLQIEGKAEEQSLSYVTEDTKHLVVSRNTETRLKTQMRLASFCISRNALRRAVLYFTKALRFTRIHTLTQTRPP